MTPRPIPGEQYIVPEDTTMEMLSCHAYGTPDNASLIWGANESRATSDIKAGEILIIPGIKPEVKLTGKHPDEMTFIVGGLEIPTVSARIVRTMDTGTSGWSGKMPWTPGLDSALDKATCFRSPVHHTTTNV